MSQFNSLGANLNNAEGSQFTSLGGSSAIPEEVELTNLPYTENNLQEDRYFLPISNYMKNRYGADNVRIEDRKDLIEKFTNNMRGFSAGNSVRSVSELRYLHSLEEGGPELATAGEAYEIFEGMSGLFSGELSVGEGLEVVQDYTRTTLVDPVNLLAGWFGKAVSGGSSKVAMLAAKSLAQKAFQKKLAAGATEKVATKAGEKVFKSVLAKAGRKQATSKLLKDTGFKAIVSKEGIKYVAGSTAIDTAAAVVTDIGYQGGLIKAGAQEEYSALQTGLAALGGLFMGGISAGRIAVRGTQNIAMPDLQVSFKGVGSKSSGAVAKLTDTLKELNTIKEGEWAEKVMRGKKLKDFGPDFWEKFILEDKEIGVKGLGQILYEDGYRWTPRSEDDKITNFLADVIKEQGEELNPFLDELKLITGKKYTAKQFGDALANSMSEAGERLQVQSKAARLLTEGINPSAGKIVEAELAGVGVLKKYGGEEFNKFQNNLIRLLVSNPATTLRNIRGWGVYSTLNSVTDLIQAGLYGGHGLVTGSKASLRKASGFAASQRMKFASIVDPEMAYESFLSMTRLHEKEFAALSHTHVGGVFNPDEVLGLTKMGAKEHPLKVAGKAFDKYTEFANIISGVKVQDTVTKSIEFNYQMDKHLRIKFGKGMSDFYAHADVSQMISGEDYAWALTRSIGETEKSIFSKSYRDAKVVGKLATAVEDVRKIPIIGLTMPFGRFFNNTVAFMADHTGVSLGMRLFGGNVMDHDRDSVELFVRGAVGLSTIYAFALKDKEDLEKSVPLKPIGHLETFTGRTMDAASEFPIAPAKAIARAYAYATTPGISMSPEETEEALKLLTGQLTRNLSTSSGNITEVAMSMLQGENKDTVRKLTEVLSSLPAQVVQSATRWIDPINEAAGLVRGEEATVSDRRQGKLKINSTLRYLDQIFEGLSLKESGDQKYSASTGEVARRPSAVLGSKEIEYTETMKLMDYVGMPYWKLDSYSKAPEADNRWNQVFFEVFDNMAADLIHSKDFLKGDREYKRKRYSDIKTAANEEVYKQLEMDMKVDDAEFALVLKISKAHGWSAIDKGIEDMGYTGDLVDLTLKELNFFKDWLENREDIRKTIYTTK